ncbi:MAG: TetR family transcriptional regulator [Myxococcales bacterium]|nr:TetR family transcriptional regulator [Myxococcales bacterium]
MGRPLDIEKRRQLARRAISALQELGLETSMARLAEALGMKRPTLLYYFPDIAAIAESALEDVLAEQALYVLERIAQHEHPVDQLYAQVTAIHAFHHGREDRLLFLGQAIGAAPRERMQRFIDIGNVVFAAHREAMVARIRAAIAAGTMHACDPLALMQLVRSVNDGLVVQRVMTGIDLAPVHRFLWEHVLAPLKKTSNSKKTAKKRSQRKRR